MGYIIIAAALVIAVVLFLLLRRGERKSTRRYDPRGFDHNRIHKNGTKFDDFGYDYFGFDADGYNRQGYNLFGRNKKGQYDRFFDTMSSAEEGFFDPKQYPIVITTHASLRLEERLKIMDSHKMMQQVTRAYRFGRSRRQIKKSSSYLIEEIERRHENGIALIYKNYIYIFAPENKLITVYENERIPL